MSYLTKTEYKILPIEAYRIIRGCAGCGGKASYRSTGNFRINANGNRIDVWLIYQCEKCRHTYNLPIYERVRPAEIPEREYTCLMENDAQMALRLGTDRQLFARCRAEIDWEAVYWKAVPKERPEQDTEQILLLDNPYELKLRTDKVVAQILGLTRNKVRQLGEQDKIRIEQNYLGRRTQVWIAGGFYE